MKMSKVEIFKRKAWTPDPSYPYGFKPFATEGRHVKYVETVEQARAECMAHNKNRPEFPSAGYFNFVYLEFRKI